MTLSQHLAFPSWGKWLQCEYGISCISASGLPNLFWKCPSWPWQYLLLKHPISVRWWDEFPSFSWLVHVRDHFHEHTPPFKCTTDKSKTFETPTNCILDKLKGLPTFYTFDKLHKKTSIMSHVYLKLSSRVKKNNILPTENPNYASWSMSWWDFHSI